MTESTVATLNDVRTRFTMAEKTLHGLIDSLSDIKTATASFNSSGKSLETVSGEIGGMAGRLSSAVDAITEGISIMRSGMTVLEVSDPGKVVSELSRLRNEVTASKESLSTEMGAVVSASTASIGALHTIIRGDIESHQLPVLERLEAAQNVSTEMVTRIEELRTRVEGAGTSIAAVKEGVKTALSQLDRLTNQVSVHDALVKTLDEEGTALHNRTTVLLDEIHTSVKNVQTAEAQLVDDVSALRSVVNALTIDTREARLALVSEVERSTAGVTAKFAGLTGTIERLMQHQADATRAVQSDVERRDKRLLMTVGGVGVLLVAAMYLLRP